ncbi:LuxR C-terminal-related transcriptional regulator [Paenibacillus koleovorans]|uniref:LuxR C-terminal-related transcriptional regulator n=1 Tax=Paenibacillus koleovorans TaxID=121608 RepID=UPI000FD704BB|nr:LuxR C-terminal-related transcriptional regulator [Paenibacillus koleovorans]
MIVGAKLQLPFTRSALVHRPLMTEKLNKGLNTKLTILIAPAGYGKTTALSDWVKQCEAPAAWISLDKKDNDPFRFWNHVTTAIGQVYADFVEIMHPILSEYSLVSTERLVAALLEGLSRYTGELIIMLDDYHVLESVIIHTAMAELLQYLPDHIHMFVTTRAELPFPTTRLIAKGQVHKIVVQDFRFQLEEGVSYFRYCMELSLSREDIGLLVQHTEGWVSGLQLAGLSLKENGIDPDFIRGFNGRQRDVSDYLLEEVLQHQTEQTQLFLLQTAILHRMNSSLCEQVTGQSDGQAQLERLERLNLFVVPLDGQRDWYRYHHLFANFLQRQLREKYKDHWRQAHANAARWFEANGFAEEAIDYLIEGHHYSEAVRVIEKLLPVLMKSQWTILHHWFTVLPEEHIFELPMINIFYIGILMGIGQSEAAEARAERAQAHLENVTDPLEMTSDHKQAAGTLYFLQAIMAFNRKDIVRTDAYFEKFDAYLPDGSLFQILGANSAHGPQVGDILAHINELRLAETFILHWMTRWDRKRNYPFVGYFMVSYSELMYEWNRLEEAERYARAVMQRKDIQPFAKIVVQAALVGSLVQQAKGAPQAAIDLLEQTKANIVTPDEQSFRSKIEGQQAILSFRHESGLRAAQWLQECGLTYTDRIVYTRFGEYILLARVLIKLGQENEALHLLDRLYQLAYNEDCLRDRIRALVLKCILCAQMGSIEDAWVKLEFALHLGECERYCRSFVDEGEPMAKLLLNYLQQRQNGFIRPSERTVSLLYVKRLLQIINANLDHLPLLPSLLTEQETRILGLIGKGLSSKEIAQLLEVAVATVQSHIKNIYRKLEVNSRSQAVHRGKELHLI